MPRPPSKYGRANSREGTISFQLDTKGLDEFARKVRSDYPKAGVFLRRAHRAMAVELQNKIAANLEQKIEFRGRLQREDQLLVKAIKSPRFIAADNLGFSLGNIAQINPQVAKYYVGLEIGQRKFVGRTIIGMFSGPEGPPNFIRFNKEGGERKDVRFVQFHQRIGPPPPMGFHDPGRAKRGRGRPKRYHRPFIKIEHEISAYHYFRDGIAAFRKSPGSQMKVAYGKAFGSSDNFVAAWASGGGGGRGPRASATSARFTVPKK